MNDNDINHQSNLCIQMNNNIANYELGELSGQNSQDAIWHDIIAQEYNGNPTVREMATQDSQKFTLSYRDDVQLAIHQSYQSQGQSFLINVPSRSPSPEYVIISDSDNDSSFGRLMSEIRTPNLDYQEERSPSPFSFFGQDILSPSSNSENSDVAMDPFSNHCKGPVQVDSMSINDNFAGPISQPIDMRDILPGFDAEFTEKVIQREMDLETYAKTQPILHRQLLEEISSIKDAKKAEIQTTIYALKAAHDEQRSALEKEQREVLASHVLSASDEYDEIETGVEQMYNRKMLKLFQDTFKNPSFQPETMKRLATYKDVAGPKKTENQVFVIESHSAGYVYHHPECSKCSNNLTARIMPESVAIWSGRTRANGTCCKGHFQFDRKSIF